MDKDENGNVLPDNRVTGIYYARANAVNLEPNTITNTVKYEYDDLGRNTSKTVKSTYFILGGEEVEGNEISSENYEYKQVSASSADGIRTSSLINKIKK